MRLALAASLLVATPAIAGAATGESELRTAEQHAVAGDPNALDELEALGRQRPITPWTDDAWSVAARFAEQRGELSRARADLQQVLAISDDEQVRTRAQATLERLGTVGGSAGEWDAVAARHDQLLAELAGSGDPKPTLRKLEQLVREHPGYPRIAAAMMTIARGYERDGDRARAIALLRETQAIVERGGEATGGGARSGAMGSGAASGGASPSLDRVTAELVRTLVRADELDQAQRLIATLSDHGLARQLRELVDKARMRARIRIGVGAVLLAIVVLAVVAMRRRAGSWRGVGRSLARPPIEALFFLPISVVIVIVASTGNPLVASAVRWIAFAGLLTAWCSGVLLGLRRPSRVGLAAHALLAAVAVLSITFLAIERDRTLDLVIETWRGGPAMR